MSPATASKAEAPAGKRNRFPWWLLVAAAIVLLILLAKGAAAQSQRNVDIIERTLQLQPQVENGRKLYAEHCASCHGLEALGSCSGGAGRSGATGLAASACAGRFCFFFFLTGGAANTATGAASRTAARIRTGRVMAKKG